MRKVINYCFLRGKHLSKVWKILTVVSVLLGLALGGREIYLAVVPDKEGKDYLPIFDQSILKNDTGAIEKIIEEIGENGSLQDVRVFSLGLLRLMNPLKYQGNGIEFMKKIPVNSDLYDFSISLSLYYLQAAEKNSCNTAEIMDFAESMKKRGDMGIRYYLAQIDADFAHKIYPIGSLRRVFAWKGVNFWSCLKGGDKYAAIAQSFKKDFSRSGFIFTDEGSAIGVSPGKPVNGNLRTLMVPKILGSLHTHAAIRFKDEGKYTNAMYQMKEACKYLNQKPNQAAGKLFYSELRSPSYFLLANLINTTGVSCKHW